jgi:tetratricopeptide (TPR) repeat protein
VIGLSWLSASLSAALTRETEAVHQVNRERVRADAEELRAQIESIQRLIDRGAWNSVLTLLKDPVLKKYDKPTELQLWRVEAHEALNQPTEAAELIHYIAEHIERNDPLLGRVLLFQADTIRLQDHAASERLVHGAIESGLPPAELAYAQALIAETFPEAIDRLHDVLNEDPFHRRAYRLLCASLMFSGRIDDAVARASEARGLFPDDANFPLVLAMAAALRGDQASVENHLASLARLADPETFEASLQLVQIFKSIRDTVPADDEFAAVSIRPIIELVMGVVRFSQGKLQLGAPTQMRKALAAVLLAEQTRWNPLTNNEQLIDAYEEAARILPLSIFIGSHGSSLEQAGRHREAAEVFLKAAAAPEFLRGDRRRALAQASVNLFLHGVQSGKKAPAPELDEAYRILGEYVETGDPSPRLLYQVCDIFLKREVYQLRAHQILERAYAKDPRTPGIASLLTRSHQIRGDHYRAWELAEEALRLDPMDSQAKGVRDEAAKALEAWWRRDQGFPPDIP